MERIKVGISVGDLTGIGLEVVIKALSDHRVMDGITPVIYASSKVISFHKKATQLDQFNFMSIKSADEIKNKKVNLVNCWKEEVEFNFGEPSTEVGAYAFRSLEAATKDLASNKVDVLVTAPIDKKYIQSDDFDFPGHTEYLARLSNVDEALMLLVSGDLRVGVATGHIPLKDVPGKLTKKLIVNKLEMMDHSLRKDFGIVKPKIAVMGLNPHAGEKGLLGDEEGKVITPAIAQAKDNGIFAFGPYAADGFFGSSNFRNFDGILAMYHDQGLAPFKALSFGAGVNFTAGLPIVRTSPDHGTGYEIAGKNMANEASFRHALFLACDIYRNRKMHKEMTESPLEPQSMKD